MADGTDVSNVVESKQYIDVMINNEQYGIDINFIDNIVRMQRITRVPKAQDYFPGVINLRGEIIPVMSLRRRFGFEDDVVTHQTRIIILKPEPQASIGFIVDEVKEVINIKEEEIDRVVTSEDKNTFIAGVGKHTKGLVSILNISAVLQDKEQD